MLWFPFRRPQLRWGPNDVLPHSGNWYQSADSVSLHFLCLRLISCPFWGSERTTAVVSVEVCTFSGGKLCVKHRKALRLFWTAVQFEFFKGKRSNWLPLWGFQCGGTWCPCALPLGRLQKFHQTQMDSGLKITLYLNYESTLMVCGEAVGVKTLPTSAYLSVCFLYPIRWS